MPGMAWELWDTESGNIVNTYPTREAALAVVREAMRRHGRHYVQHWSLGSSDPDDGVIPVIEGDDLAHQAHNIVSA
jgi:hypothetical protein